MADMIRVEVIAEKIFLIRGQKVMLDADLAGLYGVPTKALNQAVKRNKDRFPDDFMFLLTKNERDQLVTNCDRLQNLKHSSGMPYAFSEQGVAMLSSVLRSKTAVATNILIMRAFVRLRHMIQGSDALRFAIEGLEKRTTKNERDIHLAMNYLQKVLFPPPDYMIPKPRKIGFQTSKDEPSEKK